MTIIELDDEEMQRLNLALGLAMGTAMRMKSMPLAENILMLTNKVNRNNPNFTPYGLETQENTNAASH